MSCEYPFIIPAVVLYSQLVLTRVGFFPPTSFDSIKIASDDP